MALKVELKPNERVIVGTALIRNGDARARFYIEGDAPILREKDILTAATADTPAKKIYLAVQLMYLLGEPPSPDGPYLPLVREFLDAAPSSRPLLNEVSTLVLNGDTYKALKAAKRLIAYEKDLFVHATRGSERLREDGPDHAIAAGA